ncbi:GNAT family N-acetyltransferase [Chryseobacterium sp. MYb264]|uniref:GNAT family N-acetyltransferase n=1 Tax=Chryseobacterium sp. MYb264 TaxID=2745153 RepID=UPI002E151800|nr:GNAT family N-acetyltransferase [Chryseobacterium sp. MYb264]
MNFIHLQSRKATENDMDFLLDLRIKTMNEHLKSSGFPTDDDTHLKRILYEFETAKIMMYRKEDIGLLKVKYKKDEIELIQLQIHPDFQGKGFGKHILKMIIEESLFSEIPVYLSVLKTNPAQKLYARVGFRTVEENEHSFTMKFSK